MEFRKQQDLDNILAWQPPEVCLPQICPCSPTPQPKTLSPLLVCIQVIKLYSPNSICGYDREGGPIWYHIATGLDVKGLFLSVSKQELLRDKFRSCELLLHQCELQTQKV